MNSFRWTRAVSALSVLALVVGTFSVVASAGASSKKKISVPIAILSSETGTFSAYAIPYIQSGEFAVSQINKTGFKVDGKTYKFSLYVKNDNSDTATAVQEATGLISKHIVAMFGPLASLAPPVEQLTNHAKVVFFDPSSAVSPTAGPPSNPLVFITNGDAGATGTYWTEAIQSFVPGAKSVAVLGPDEAAVTADVPLEQAAAQKAGLTFYNDVYPLGTTDLSSVLTTMAGQDPSAVIMLDYGADEQLQASQFASSGVPKTTTMLLFGNTISECQTLGAANGYPCIADTVAGVDLSSPDLSTYSKDWIKGFEAYTHTTSLPALIAQGTWSYDYVFMLAQAMAKAGTVTNTAKIAKALHEVTRHGLVGALTFNAHNGSEFPLVFDYVPVSGPIVTKSFAP